MEGHGEGLILEEGNASLITAKNISILMSELQRDSLCVNSC